MPYLIAPVMVDGKLDCQRLCLEPSSPSSPTAEIVVRDKLAFIQDAYVRDVNATPIGKADDPATVDVPALAARLLADAKRVAGPNLVSAIEIIRIQMTPLHPGHAQLIPRNCGHFSPNNSPFDHVAARGRLLACSAAFESGPFWPVLRL